MPTFEETRRGFLNLWNKADYRSTQWHESLDEHAGAIISEKDRYMAVQKTAGAPWFWIGCVHTREASRNFNTYLGNGQPLNQVTTIVPKGRGPFKSWEAGAIDALKVLKQLDKITEWSIERCLFEFERYNGFGYMRAGISINSPYNWSGTTLYTRGKYVADRVFSSTTVDKQPGCAGILKSLINLDDDVRNHFGVSPPEPTPNERVAQLFKDIEDSLTELKTTIKGE